MYVSWWKETKAYKHRPDQKEGSVLPSTSLYKEGCGTPIKYLNGELLASDGDILKM